MVGASIAPADPLAGIRPADDATTDSVRRVLGLGAQVPVQPIAGDRFPVVRYEVEALAPDGVLIHGTYWPTARRRDAPVVILLTDRRYQRQDLERVAIFLSENGISALTMDLRGTGQSVRAADGTLLDIAQMESDPTGEHIRRVPADVSAVIDWLQHHHLVKRGGCYLMGSGMATTACGIALVNEGPRVSGMIALSPALRYRGLDLQERLAEIQGRPVLAVAPGASRQLIDTVRRLQSANRNTVASIVLDTTEGTVLIDHPEVRQSILDFIRSTESRRAL